MAVQNKFLEMLKKKPKQSSKLAVQMIVPGVKSRGDCAAGCLILRNCQNLNKRLLSLTFQYREVLAKVTAFLYTPRRNRNNPNEREYNNGYEQCSEDIARIANKAMLREEEKIIDIQTIMSESYTFLCEVEGIIKNQRNGNITAASKARDLRLRYDALYSKLQGGIDNE